MPRAAVHGVAKPRTAEPRAVKPRAAKPGAVEPRTAGPGARSLSRRQAGSGSVRSLLLTMLGEFALPSGEPSWTSTLLHVAGGLGVEEKSTRQALTRLAGDGWIAAERVGRRARWRLTQSGRELLAEGAARIYAFGRDREFWDGRWLVLTVTVPETTRELRHQLRTRLTWAGFGSPAPGVWVSPHPAREGDAKGVVEQLGLDAAAFSFSGPYAGVGSERTLVEQAWHLGDLAADYEDFLQEFAGLRPGPGDPTLLAQVRLVHEWRKFPMRDPELPRELLPPDWVGVRAANVFTDLHTTWTPHAQHHWATLAAAA